MSRKDTHELWSWDGQNRMWLAISQGPEDLMESGRVSRYAAARKYELWGAAFVARPVGQPPVATPVELDVEVVAESPAVITQEWVGGLLSAARSAGDAVTMSAAVQAAARALGETVPPGGVRLCDDDCLHGSCRAVKALAAAGLLVAGAGEGR